MALAAISMADKPPPHKRVLQRRPPPHLKRLAPRPGPPQHKKVPATFQRHAKKLRDPKLARKPHLRPAPKQLKPQARQTVFQNIRQSLPAARPLPSAQVIRQNLGIRPVSLQPPRVPNLRPANPATRLRGLGADIRSRFNVVRTRLNTAGATFRQRLPTLPQRFRNVIGVSAKAAAAVPPAHRRNSKLPAVFFKQAEDIPGYTKFTLDDVITDSDSPVAPAAAVAPEAIEPRKPQVDDITAREDNEEDVILVDTAKDAKDAKSVKAEKADDKPDSESAAALPSEFKLKR